MTGPDSHVWRSGMSGPLDDWLSQNQPSKISNNGADSDGFLWALSPAFVSEPTAGTDAEPILPGQSLDGESVEEAKKVFEEALAQAQKIKDDPEIPVRANKKDGKPSKKQVRDVLCETVKQQLETIAKDADMKSGKWLMFAAKDSVDYIWSKLARSVVDGPLSKLTQAKCQAISVATSDSDGSRGADTRMLSIHFEDCFDRDVALEVLRCVVAEHGESLSAVKADLWSAVGIDSTNPLGLRSTLFQAKELMPQEEIADLRRAWQEQRGEGAGGKKIVKAVASAATSAQAATTGDVSKNGADAKPSEEDDGFESDGEEPTGVVGKAAPPKDDGGFESEEPAAVAKVLPAPAPAKDKDDEFEDDEDADAELPRGTKRSGNGGAPLAARPAVPAKKKQKKELRDAF